MGTQKTCLFRQGGQKHQKHEIGVTPSMGISQENHTVKTTPAIKPIHKNTTRQKINHQNPKSDKKCKTRKCRKSKIKNNKSKKSPKSIQKSTPRKKVLHKKWTFLQKGVPKTVQKTRKKKT